MTLSTFKKLFEEFQESGLNVRDFCSNHSFAPSSFYYWKNKLEETSQHQPDSFVPLILDSSQLATSRPAATSSKASDHGSGNQAPIEFVFPNGTKMMLRDKVDMPLLKAIVHLFD